MSLPAVPMRRWTRHEYEQLIGLGVFKPEEPRNAPHATAVLAVQEALRAVVGTRWHVRPQCPGLVVEVADTTLASDRRKAGLFARAAVEEFWIVNLVAQALEVSRRPEYAPQAPFAWVYADTQVLRRDDIVTPLVAPGARISVGDLLP